MANFDAETVVAFPGAGAATVTTIAETTPTSGTVRLQDSLQLNLPQRHRIRRFPVKDFNVVMVGASIDIRAATVETIAETIPTKDSVPQHQIGHGRRLHRQPRQRAVVNFGAETVVAFLGVGAAMEQMTAETIQTSGTVRLQDSPRLDFPQLHRIRRSVKDLDVVMAGASMDTRAATVETIAETIPTRGSVLRHRRRHRQRATVNFGAQTVVAFHGVGAATEQMTAETIQTNGIARLQDYRQLRSPQLRHRPRRSSVKDFDVVMAGASIGTCAATVEMIAETILTRDSVLRQQLGQRRRLQLAKVNFGAEIIAAFTGIGFATVIMTAETIQTK